MSSILFVQIGDDEARYLAPAGLAEDEQPLDGEDAESITGLHAAELAQVSPTYTQNRLRLAL